MAGRFLSLFRVFRGKKKKSHEAAPPQQHENPEQFQPQEDDAALDHTEEKKPARGRFRKTLKTFWKFPRIRRRKTGSAAAEGPAEPGSGLTERQAEPDVSPDSPECSENSDTSVTETWAKALLMPEVVVITNTNNGETQGLTNTGTRPPPTVIHAPTMYFLKASAVPSQQQQVPAIVRNIHQSLMSQDTVNVWLKTDILRLAEEQPADVVLTLLRCAPTCDRAAAMIWRTIGSSSPTVEKVLPVLLCVMENWPLHSMCTSDGDNEEVFALAATVVLRVIVPECNKAMIPYSGQLFVALLFHVVITTQQIPSEEVATFWRACQEEHRLRCKPNRFAVQAMKALLCQLQRDHVVLALARKRGSDMLLRADTQHYAVGLLAREMRGIFFALCSLIALQLFKWLRREEPHCDLPFLAFLVEVLHCLDLNECGDRVLEMMSRHLRSECRERRCLALRGLVVLSKDPSMARRMCRLSPRLLELLGDAQEYVVSMTLSVLTNILENEHILISSTTAPKLAEALLPLFDHDDVHMQLLSLDLFFKVMDLVVDKEKKPLKRIVRQSLLPLFFHCHNKNECVAEASRELLLCAATFLKRKKLKRLLERKKMWKFTECLVRRAGKPQPQPGEAP
nr:maestro heat-like repeat-containing protein family member 7 [Taeniopygia guttata]